MKNWDIFQKTVAASMGVILFFLTIIYKNLDDQADDLKLLAIAAGVSGTKIQVLEKEVDRLRTRINELADRLNKQGTSMEAVLTHSPRQPNYPGFDYPPKEIIKPDQRVYRKLFNTI